MKKITLGKLQEALNRITLSSLQQSTAKIIVEDKKLLSRKRDEMKAGVNPDGSIIGTYRSESYRLFKIQKNPLAGGNVDLILTGSTAQKLGTDSLGNSVFKIRSTDEKWNDLISKYGTQIQTINPEIWTGLQKSEYAPKLIQQMKRISRL